MNHLLYITPATVKRAREVKEYALAHRYNMQAVLDVFAHPERAPGCFPGFVLEVHGVNGGARIVYSIMEQPEPVGYCAHFSVSLDEINGKCSFVAPRVVRDIFLPLMDLKLEDCFYSYPEESKTGRKVCNLLFKLSAQDRMFLKLADENQKPYERTNIEPTNCRN